MLFVRSKDGTSIAYDRQGQGPALILVNGALAQRSDAATVAGKLAPYFTTFTYDRRGRGDSGDSAQNIPWPKRLRALPSTCEVDDLEAVINEAGGKAFVFGHSSGAVLALEGARLLPNRVTKLALYEPPFVIDDSRPPLPVDYRDRLADLIASGRPGDAVEYFMNTLVGVPAGAVASMRASPMWPGMEQVAHTLPYDTLIMGDTMHGDPASLQKWAAVSTSTLVMDGGDSPASMQHSAEAIARVLPNAHHRRFPGQTHGVADEVLVPALVEFFLD